MFKTVHASALTLLVLAMQSPTAQAVPNSFIQFTDSGGTPFKGESLVLGHEDWSEVDAWSWLVSAESSFIKGGGASVGKPQPGPFRWQQDLDRTYPKLFTFLVQGKHSAKVKFDVTTNTGGSKPEGHFSKPPSHPERARRHDAKHDHPAHQALGLLASPTHG